MGDKKSVSALVSGGEANAGPPLGPALGPIGVNVLQVVNTINEKTKDFPGMKVPVKVEVDTDLGPLREWPEFKALFRDWHARQEGN